MKRFEMGARDWPLVINRLGAALEVERTRLLRHYPMPDLSANHRGRKKAKGEISLFSLSDIGESTLT